jgi:hypothetical protein
MAGNATPRASRQVAISKRSRNPWGLQPILKTESQTKPGESLRVFLFNALDSVRASRTVTA